MHEVEVEAEACSIYEQWLFSPWPFHRSGIVVKDGQLGRKMAESGKYSI